jgi:hypothetical protein
MEYHLKRGPTTVTYCSAKVKTKARPPLVANSPNTPLWHSWCRGRSFLLFPLNSSWRTSKSVTVIRQLCALYQWDIRWWNRIVFCRCAGNCHVLSTLASRNRLCVTESADLCGCDGYCGDRRQAAFRKWHKGLHTFRYVKKVISMGLLYLQEYELGCTYGSRLFSSNHLSSQRVFSFNLYLRVGME